MIKILRVTSYDVITGLCEFIDNALDAGATRVEICLREKIQGTRRRPHRITISDDVPGGIPSEVLPRIFSLTYDRARSPSEIREYGLGFKAASFNLAEKMMVYTRSGSGSEPGKQVTVDWVEMGDSDRWDPEILAVGPEMYERNHPFSCGSSFILENLRPDFFPVADTEDTLAGWYDQLVYIYRYLLHAMPGFSITLRGVWSPSITPSSSSSSRIESRDLRGHEMFSWAMDPCPEMGNPVLGEGNGSWIYSVLKVFQDDMGRYRVYIASGPERRPAPHAASVMDGWIEDRVLKNPMERVECTKKWKNGNSNYRTVPQAAVDMEGMVLVDTLIFRSVHEPEAMRSSALMQSYSTCRLDIRRGQRVVARDLNLRHPDSQKLQYFVHHELRYHQYALNVHLGIQFNKKNPGGLPEGDLRNVLEYLQNRHEKICEDRERHLYATRHLPPSSPPSPAPPLVPVVLPLSIPVVVDNTTTAGTVGMVMEPKRRPFSEKTKIHTLQRQECRDRILDVILDNHVHPMEYDHADGTPANNSSDNCQALSVITHAIKTRSPEIYDRIETDTTGEARLDFILRLLHSILRSKYMEEAFSSSTVVFDPSSRRFVMQPQTMESL